MTVVFIFETFIIIIKFLERRITMTETIGQIIGFVAMAVMMLLAK